MSQNIKSNVLSLVNLIEYQIDSIVSKIVINNTGGTVTLFAFDKNQKLSEHTAPFDAMVSIIDGDAKITISGKSFYLKKGESIIMPANEPHAVEAEKKFKMMLIMIKS
jgi:quercetin dioxygenase-like cupin family protein